MITSIGAWSRVALRLSMELWQLRTFSTVAETGSFTRASEVLNLSQPAVSIQVKAIESEAGRKLFVRRPDGVDLTRDGELFLEHARRILDLADQITSEMHRATMSPEKGVIATGAVTRGLENFFIWTYIEFRRVRPDLEIKPQTLKDPESGIKFLKYGSKVDLVLSPFDPRDPEIETVLFGTVNVAVIARKEHRLAQRPRVSPSMLEIERWVLLEPDDRLRKRAEGRFLESGIRPRSVLSTNDGSVIPELLTKTDMVTMLHTSSVLSKLRDQTLTTINCPELESEAQLYFCYRKDKESVDKVMPLLEFFAERWKVDGGLSIGLRIEESFVETVLGAKSNSK